MRDPFDRCSKWLIGHFGGSLLRLGGAPPPRSWRPLQAEIVHPRQLPDGLLEVFFDGRDEPDLFLVEVVTYADRRAREQMLRDLAMVLIDRRVLPEILTLVLRPRGQVEVPDEEELSSRLGWTGLRARWRVAELWKIPAESLLEAGDAGLLPWVPLAESSSPPETTLRRCRERIETLAPEAEVENLLAIASVMARLRYNDPKYLTLFGGRKTMIESPLIQELLAEKEQKSILLLLADRFGQVPTDIAASLEAIQDEDRLDSLLLQVYRCADLDDFRSRLQ